MNKSIALTLAVLVILVVIGWLIVSAKNQANLDEINKARAPYQTVERMLNEITPSP